LQHLVQVQRAVQVFVGLVKRLQFLAAVLDFLRAFGHLGFQLAAARLHAAHASPDANCYQPGQQRSYAQAEPERLPERRHNANPQRGPLFIPDAIVIGGFDAQGVFPTGQVGIASDTVRSGVNPILIQPFQHIGILVLPGIGILESGKLEGKHIFVIRQFNFFGK